jgi:SAM-dependent methyltransferase
VSFAGKTLAEVRAEMDRLYAQGPAYVAPTLWDRDRTKRLYDAVLELAQTDGHKTRLTLDVGCGDGGVASFWPSRTVGIEISEEACKAARAKHPDREFHCSAIEDLDDPRVFDTVVAVESIEHWVDADRGLEKIREHIVAGAEYRDEDGLLIVTTPNLDSLHHRIGRRLGVWVPFCSNDHVREFGFEELKGLLAKHGFEVVRSLGVGLAPYWALESVFGTRIRELTDHDHELVELLGRAGRDVPEIAFIQAHACRPV